MVEAGSRGRGRLVGLMLLVITMATAGTAAGPAQTQPAGVAVADQSTTRPATQPVIPLVFANDSGKPFLDMPDGELNRIRKQADALTPPGKEIWFVLVRSGTWFPAAEVYFRPEKSDGRVFRGQCAFIWREDSEKTVGRMIGPGREQYVWVVDPNAEMPRLGAKGAFPIPKAAWLPFHTGAKNEDKLILMLVDAVQSYRAGDKENAGPGMDKPIMGIERDGEDFNVLVAWPDQGYEDICVVKRKGNGVEATGWTWVVH